MNERSFHVVLGTGRSASPWPLISPASGVRASLRIDAVEPLPDSVEVVGGHRRG
jgi:hypothetical protein